PTHDRLAFRKELCRRNILGGQERRKSKPPSILNVSPIGRSQRLVIAPSHLDRTDGSRDRHPLERVYDLLGVHAAGFLHGFYEKHRGAVSAEGRESWRNRLRSAFFLSEGGILLHELLVGRSIGIVPEVAGAPISILVERLISHLRDRHGIGHEVEEETRFIQDPGLDSLLQKPHHA